MSGGHGPHQAPRPMHAMLLELAALGQVTLSSASVIGPTLWLITILRQSPGGRVFGHVTHEAADPETVVRAAHDALIGGGK